MDEDFMNKWNELKNVVESLELDVHRNANGNATAGVRVRKGLRQAKSIVTHLIRVTVERDKVRKAIRKESRTKK